MLTTLTAYLPAPGGPLPDPTVCVASLTEKMAGLGGLRGTDVRAGFPVVQLKGIRLDAVVQFQLWGTGPAQADAALTSLITKLSADSAKLWGAGVLRFSLEASPPAEAVSSLGAWRKHADYRILYEYAYADSDDTQSLIARIPVAIDSALDENMSISDNLARWDDKGAPLLSIRGQVRVTGFSALYFTPGAAPASSVTLTRTFDGASGPPSAHATVADFLASVAGAEPLQRHAQIVFTSFTNFLAAFTSGGGPITLGDWNLDGVPDTYDPLTLSLAPGIELPSVSDRLELSYQLPALDKVAVFYVRATSG